MSSEHIWMICIGIVVMAAGGKFKWRSKSSETTYGSARWMSLWEARRLFKPKGLILGDWGRMYLRVFYSGASNILTVGPPRTMKGAGMLIPNALTYPFIILFDPGGQITSVCKKHWVAQGYSVQEVNPWLMHKDKPWSLGTVKFNPVDKLNSKSRIFASDAQWLAEMLLPRSDKAGSEGFFNNVAHSGLKVMLMHIASQDQYPRTLLTIRILLLSSTSEWKKFRQDLIANEADALLRRQGKAWEKEETNAPRMFQSILSTMIDATSWLEDQVIRDVMDGSGVRFEDLKGFDKDGKKLKGAIIPIIIPLEYKESHAPFVRLAIACALMTMQRGELAKQNVLFMLDEFAALGKMNLVVDGLATLGKYRVWLHLVVHSIGQMSDIYGQAWSKIESCCEVRQWIAPRDWDTAKHVSQLCGQATVETENRNQSGSSFGMTGRPLLMPDEVMQLPVDEQIVFIGNRRPARLHIRPYWQRPELRGTFERDPYHEETPGLPKDWRLQLVIGEVTRVWATQRVTIALAVVVCVAGAAAVVLT